MIQSLYLTVQGTFFQYIGDILKITIPVYLIILTIKFFRKGKSCMDLSKCLLEFIFLGYIITVLILTDILTISLNDFDTFHMTPNLIPFASTINDLMNYPSIVFQQILLNIIFFIPFGFLSAILFHKEKKILMKTIIFSLIFTVSIEILEYLVGRYFDIDDILWNVIGAIIGIVLFKCFINLHKTYKNLTSLKK